MENKKGLTRRMIAFLVVLIVSFIIILIFIWLYDWTGEVDKQACHESVVIMASTWKPDGTTVIETPLKCETEKICVIIKKSENCDEQFIGEKYEKYEISGGKEEMNKAVNYLFAEKMRECWGMMGAANLEIFGRNLGDKLQCIQCTRIAFSKEVKQELNNQVTGTNNYLLNTPIEDTDQSYWQYLTKNPANYMEGYEEDDDKRELTQKVIVFSEFNKGNMDVWITRGVGTAGGAIVGGIIGSIVPGPGTTLGAGVGASGGAWLGDEIGNYFDNLGEKTNTYSSIVMLDYNTAVLKEKKCTSFEGSL